MPDPDPERLGDGRLLVARGAEPPACSATAWQAAHPGFVRMAWLLPLGFSLLEAEQWDIVAFCQRRFPGVAAASAAHMRLMIVAAVLIGWLWARTAMHARSARRAAFGILPFA